jgi:hypothetical protein
MDWNHTQFITKIDDIEETLIACVIAKPYELN